MIASSPLTKPDPTYVLVVQSDESLAQAIRQDLWESGYQVIVTADAASALQRAGDITPALIVLDRSLVGSASGFSLCTQLRQMGLKSAILIMLSKETVEDRAACLAAGADDYFLRPYRSDDFLRLIQHYLVRDTVPQEVLQFSNLTLDLSTRQAYRNDTAIDLTMKEFELLKYLMENPREVLTREQILENVWGYDSGGESNVIEVYIRYLRLKIEDNDNKRLIQTVRGVGYVLREV